MYNYLIYYTNKTTGKTEHHKTVADSIQTAYKIANHPLFKQTDEIARVYCTLENADSIQQAALQIVKRTTANMISKGGGDIQYRLYNGCRVAHIDDPDVLDCISVTTLALIENNNGDIDNTYRQAYLALNRHLYASRQIYLSVTAMRTIYIEDIDGDIVNVTKGINTIIKQGQGIYISDDTDDDTDELTDVIIDIVKDFTPTQKRILKYLAQGYSISQVADKMNRHRKTIYEHRDAIQRKALAKFPQGMDDIKKLLDELTD